MDAPAANKDPLTTEVLDKALTRLGKITVPPKEPVILFRDTSRMICINDEWGPPIPYGPVDHDDGTANHGYRKIKGNEAAAREITEATDLPAMADFLVAVNGPDTEFETVGCEKAFFPSDQKLAEIYLGSYFNLIFSNYEANSFDNHLRLALRLGQLMFESERWWGSVDIAIEPMKKLENTNDPWCIMLRVINHGRDENEAIQYWSHSLDILGKFLSSAQRDPNPVQ
jgi:hypothetical protein